MRGKKRKFLFGVLSLFSLLIVYLISYKYLIVPYQIKKLNDNMVIDGIPYKIGDKMDNLDLGILQDEGWEKQNMYENFISYYYKEIGFILFRGYPDYSNEPKFTLVRTRFDNLSVFGIKIGSSISDVHKILKSKGYKEKHDRLYVKGKINIGFRYDKDGKIIELDIALRSSDWFHKGYYK